MNLNSGIWTGSFEFQFVLLSFQLVTSKSELVFYQVTSKTSKNDIKFKTIKELSISDGDAKCVTLEIENKNAKNC